jgi:hypothetical protein
VGHWQSTHAYAAALLDNLGIEPTRFVPGVLRPFLGFDLDGFARDLTAGLHVGADAGGVHLFRPPDERRPEGSGGFAVDRVGRQGLEP